MKKSIIREIFIGFLFCLVIIIIFKIITLFRTQTCAYVFKESSYKNSPSFVYYFKDENKIKHGFIIQYQSKIKTLKEFKEKRCIKIEYVTFFPFINSIIDEEVVYE